MKSQTFIYIVNSILICNTSFYYQLSGLWEGKTKEFIYMDQQDITVLYQHHRVSWSWEARWFWYFLMVSIKSLFIFFLLFFLQTSLCFYLGEKQAMCKWSVYKLDLPLLSENALKHTPPFIYGMFWSKEWYFIGTYSGDGLCGFGAVFWGI